VAVAQQSDRDVDRLEDLVRGSFLVVDLRGVTNEIAGLSPLPVTVGRSSRTGALLPRRSSTRTHEAFRTRTKSIWSRCRIGGPQREDSDAGEIASLRLAFLP